MQKYAPGRELFEPEPIRLATMFKYTDYVRSSGSTVAAKQRTMIDLRCEHLYSNAPRMRSCGYTL